MTSKKEIKILFVPPLSSFIQNDLDILRKHFEVRVAHFILSIY